MCVLSKLTRRCSHINVTLPITASAPPKRWFTILRYYGTHVEIAKIPSGIKLHFYMSKVSRFDKGTRNARELLEYYIKDNNNNEKNNYHNNNSK